MRDEIAREYIRHFLSNCEIYERVVCGIVPQAIERLWIATAGGATFVAIR